MSMGICNIYSRLSCVEAVVKGRVLGSELPLILPRLEPRLLWRRVRQNRLPEFFCARLFFLPACLLLLLPAVHLLSQLLVAPRSSSPCTCILMTVSSLPQIVILLHTRKLLCSCNIASSVDFRIKTHPPPRTLQTFLFIGLFKDVTK